MTSTFYVNFQGVNKLIPASATSAMRKIAGVDLGRMVRDVSSAACRPGADNYDVTLRVAAESTFTLKKMEFLSAVKPGADKKTYYLRPAAASG